LSRIFISHSSRDNEFAQGLKQRLSAQGHTSVFLDFDPADGIQAGRQWERELYQQVRNCQVMIVVCSRASMSSRWCFMEMTHARALGKPLLAVKVDDCELDGVLTDRQVVDLVRDSEEGYARLFDGIVAAGVDPARTFSWDRTRSPYPGLLSFEEADAGIFFGRGGEIAQGLELLTRVHHLGEPRAVMVLGASGTGKSSLVRAGLVPRLRRDAERWIVVGPFRPGTDPAGALAAALRAGGGLEPADQVRGAPDDTTLVRTLAAIRGAVGAPDAKVVLVVDQFEELLGTGEEPPFLAQLRRALDDDASGAILLATMRSDFLDRFQTSRSLRDLPYELLSLGPMSEAGIREVINAPAREARVELEEPLESALVEDAGTGNALPLLAFTLRELWERCSEDRRLTLDEYRTELGGVTDVVGRVADGVLHSQRITREQERALRTAFLAMLRVTDDGRYARRPVKWNNMPEPARPLLEKFVAARLLTSGADGADRMVEVAHERLFDSWARLRGWIAENVEALALREELESDARAWDGPRDEDQLWRGARVSRARELLSEGTLLLDETGHRFLDASERAERTRRRRVVHALAAFGAFASVLALIAIVLGVRARSSAQVAEERARIAEVQRLTALSAQSFAEYQRVQARAQIDTLPPDQRRALEAIAPKYLKQSEQYETEAARLNSSPEHWRRTRGLVSPAPDAIFTFEAMRAGDGAAFLLHYGAPRTQQQVLIDGGSGITYRRVLRPRLDALRVGNKPLSLRLVVATQTDMSNLQGLIALIQDLEQRPPAAPPFAIGALWSNAFVPGTPGQHPALVQLQPKARLVMGANALGIPVNAPFSRMVAAPEAGAARVRLDGDLTITVLSPRVQWLRAFADEWLQRWRIQAERRDKPELTAALEGYDVVETFADPHIELTPSPRIIADPTNEEGTDQTLANLASLVLMIEQHGKRILVSGDATSNLILNALAQAGYSDRRGMMNIDVLVVPHGGSERSVTPDFFRRIRARNYVFSADGRFGNPDVSTIAMLFEARRDDRRPFTIAFTYAPEEYRQPYPLRELCTLLARERAAGTPFDILTPGRGNPSFAIDLGEPNPSVNHGVRDSVCGI
jgi:hypothetical protein